MFYNYQNKELMHNLSVSMSCKAWILQEASGNDVNVFTDQKF